VLAMAFHGIMMAEGNANYAMVGMVIGAIGNVILDALFIIVFDMGIIGAALATGAAQLASLVYYLYVYLSGRSFIMLRLCRMVPVFPVIWQIASVGAANLMTMVGTSMSIIFMNRMLLLFGGDMAVSAYGIVNRLIILAVMPGISTGQGLQPIVGFNYGTKRFDRALRSIKTGLLVVAAVGVFVMLAFMLFSEIIMSIFTSDPALISESAYAARIVFSTVILQGITIVCVFVFQALGKALQAFVITIRPLIFHLPLVIILPQFFKLDGVYASYPVNEFLAFLLAVILIVPLIRNFRQKIKEINKDKKAERAIYPA
jgi:Na+-driven multidrug efflux pump